MKLKVVTGIGLLLIVLIVSCQNSEQVEFDRYYSSGSLVFNSRCQNCHGQHGEGLQGLIPPLTDTGYLKKHVLSLSCDIKYGIKGNITVSNKLFEGEMPANDLPAIEIAEVLTYVTNSFGNKMGTVTSQQVEGYLEKCR
jgi:mono/diheme cytochrome c family protein